MLYWCNDCLFYRMVIIFCRPSNLIAANTVASCSDAYFYISWIKGSIEPTHGSVCSDVRKLQSMDVLKLQSAKADWNTKCSFHILAYIYSNLLAISTSYFIKILSCNERLYVDSQRTKKCTFHLDLRGERVENKEKWTSKNDFIMMPFILLWLKIKTNLIKLVLNTFMSRH